LQVTTKGSDSTMRRILRFGNKSLRKGSSMSNFKKAALKFTLQLVAVATSFLIVSSASIAQASPLSTSMTTKDYIVVFKSGTNVTTETNWWKTKGLSIRDTFRSAFQGMTLVADANQIKILRLDPDVLFVEPDSILTTQTTQSGASWGIDRVDQQDLPLDSSFSYTYAGSGVNVYVVDTGILSNHTEFSGRLLPGYTSIQDRRGTSDCDGHGTHVAGTIGGTNYGIAKQVNLTPVRVLNCNGAGPTSGVLKGLDWIANRTVPGTKAVVNMSLGGGFSPALNNAVQNIIAKGIPVVVAAGNESANACDSSPSSSTNAITVGATDSTDFFASYSNSGSCVDILAPGTDITSAFYTSSNATRMLSGTSMASPHVAGAVALLFENGYKTPGELTSILMANSIENTIDLGSVPGGTVNKFLFTGSGTQNTSVAPTTLTLNGIVGQSVVASQALVATNLPGTVTYSIAPELASGLSINASTGVISGTPTETSNRVHTITATNGSRSATATVTVTIVAAPSPSISPAAQTLTATRGVSFSSAALVSSGSFSGAVTYSISGALPSGLTISAVSGQISGTPTVTRAATNFTITARGSVSGSATASINLTVEAPPVNAAPSVPTSVLAETSSSRTAALSWTAGALNGAAVSSHTIRVFEIRNGSTRLISTLNYRGSATAVTVTGLSTGRQYQFTVSATNRFGTSAQSSPSNSVTLR